MHSDVLGEAAHDPRRLALTTSVVVSRPPMLPSGFCRQQLPNDHTCIGQRRRDAIRLQLKHPDVSACSGCSCAVPGLSHPSQQVSGHAWTVDSWDSTGRPAVPARSPTSAPLDASRSSLAPALVAQNDAASRHLRLGKAEPSGLLRSLSKPSASVAPGFASHGPEPGPLLYKIGVGHLVLTGRCRTWQSPGFGL